MMIRRGGWGGERAIGFDLSHQENIATQLANNARRNAREEQVRFGQKVLGGFLGKSENDRGTDNICGNDSGTDHLSSCDFLRLMGLFGLGETEFQNFQNGWN